MERNIKLLLAFSGVALLVVVVFAQMITPSTNSAKTGSCSGSSCATPSGVPATNTATLDARGSTGGGEVQVISLTASSSGYDKQELHVTAGQPVKLQFSANNAGCGAQLLIPEFGVNLLSKSGEMQSAEFTPPKGVYTYRCSMNMFRGKLYAE